ncbi:MAG: DNA-binding domain-containing protein [Cellvibrionaceae bacterium]|nr:DNA-binding domain-containing protein [Cellvibrionaceae bacterium]
MAAAGGRQETEHHGADTTTAAVAANHESQPPESMIADTVEDHQASEDPGETIRDRVEEERECAGARRVQELMGKTQAAAESASDNQEAGAASKTSPGKKPWETGEEIVTSLPMYKGITIQTENIGKMFFNWLKKGLIEKTILINTPVALVHIVEDGILLLSPGLFKDFCLKHGMPEKDHGPLSKKFDKLRLGIKTADGLGIHILWAVGEKRAGRVSGRLIPHHTIYGDDYPVPQINKFFKKSLTPQEE